MNKEIWKKIPFNLDYEVSNLGKIRHLTKTIYDINNGGYKTLNKVTFRNKIIAEIRDSGVPIASSKFGYKIPTKIKEINDFFTHSKTIVLPMLHRMFICAETLEIGTNGLIKILNQKGNETMKRIIEAFKENDS